MAAFPCCCCCFISGVLGAMATCFFVGDFPVFEPFEELDEDDEELPEDPLLGVLRRLGATCAILAGCLLLRSIFFSAGTGKLGLGVTTTGATGGADGTGATGAGVGKVLDACCCCCCCWAFCSFSCDRILKYLFSEAVVAGVLMVSVLAGLLCWPGCGDSLPPPGDGFIWDLKKPVILVCDSSIAATFSLLLASKEPGKSLRAFLADAAPPPVKPDPSPLNPNAAPDPAAVRLFLLAEAAGTAVEVLPRLVFHGHWSVGRRLGLPWR